jgi:transcriptional regulator with XRE-family HTH domain
LSQQYISDLEHGFRPIDWTHVQRLAAVLDVAPSALTADTVSVMTSPSGVVGIYAGAPS